MKLLQIMSIILIMNTMRIKLRVGDWGFKIFSTNCPKFQKLKLFDIAAVHGCSHMILPVDRIVVTVYLSLVMIMKLTLPSLSRLMRLDKFQEQQMLCCM